MKKRLLFVAAIFAATATFAQEGLTSKKGEAYLPEAGDWALGFDGTPFVNYIGNLANGSTGNSIGFTNGGAIYGKMFKDEKTAYRAMFQLGFASNTNNYVVNLFETPSATDTKEFTNEVKTSSNDIKLGFGIEKRRGNTRIQGVYGAMFTFGIGGQKTTYGYGLALNDSTTAANGNNVYQVGDGSSNVGVRTTEFKAGSTMTLGVQGFIGFEWFFAPKFSLGAEYRWGIEMSNRGESETTTETWDFATTTATTQSLITKTAKGGKSSAFNFGPANAGNAVLLVNFHF